MKLFYILRIEMEEVNDRNTQKELRELRQRLEYLDDIKYLCEEILQRLDKILQYLDARRKRSAL